MKAMAFRILMSLSATGLANYASASEGPSFDCAKAISADERAICSDEQLAALDRSVNISYLQSKLRAGRTTANALARSLLADRRVCGSDRVCLARWSERAIRSYDALAQNDTAQFGQTTCVVADPTTTALNVRKTPRGTLLTTILNGESVTVVETRNDDRGLPWARLSRPIGWVYANYLNCGQTAPAQERAVTAPNFGSRHVIEVLANTECVSRLAGNVLFLNMPEIKCTSPDENSLSCRDEEVVGNVLVAQIRDTTLCLQACQRQDCGLSEVHVSSPDEESMRTSDGNWGTDFDFRKGSVFYNCHTYVDQFDEERFEKPAGFHCWFK
ncbi:MAG: hypothetical protein EOS75_29425 [Mesorhizobium sp.]|nr:MAG: hypothetical protein EOS75_29425 [Mesorhizobium sp.]